MTAIFPPDAWNATRAAYPRDATIPELFTARTVATPDAPALTFGPVTLTYAELDARANRLAHLLVERGAGRETPIAIALPRSLDLIVAMLAVLKAGGAYLGLDLASPPARATYLRTDVGADLLITTADRAADHPTADIIALDTLVDDLAARPVTAPVSAATANNLAYYCYTSGSTGLPKGTELPHRVVSRLVHNPGYITLGPDETILQMCSVAFDVSVFEVWGALLTGAHLVMAPPGQLTVTEIATVLRDHAVSTLFLTTGLFHQIVELDVSALAGVRQLLVGGEAMHAVAARAALRARDNDPTINVYGPTEAAVFSTAYRMTAPEQVGERPPIGYPVPQSTAYVLSDDLLPVPVGEIGELCLGGDGVARGYHGRPGLTADKFVPDPFSDVPGARMYRSGDQARWRADGILEYLGRRDAQVKIRGFRIEPGEAEVTLRDKSGVGDAVVRVRGEGEFKHLVAWVTTIRTDHEEFTRELREHAAQRMPDHLVPSAFVVLDRFPLNINGKVDLQALPDPVTAAPPRDAEPPVAAFSPAEERLAGIWSDILRVEDIQGHDDFFSLGGNSLAATRLIFRIRDAFGVDLPMVAFYEDATLTATAATIIALRPAGAGTDGSGAGAAPDGIVRRDRSAFRSGPPA